MFLGNGKFDIHAFRPGHDRIDDCLAFFVLVDLQSGVDRLGIDRIEIKRGVDDFLDGLYHPLHQLSATLPGRAQIDVDIIDAGIRFRDGQFLDGLWVPIFHRRPNRLNHDVEILSDAYHVLSPL